MGRGGLPTVQGSRLKILIMKELTSEMHVNHHFTTAYCPWTNGTVEQLCREAPMINMALLSKRKLSVAQWPTILESIQKIRNQHLTEDFDSKDTGKIRCPMKLFIGLKPSTLLLRPSPLRRFCELQSINEERCNQLINISHRQTALFRKHSSIVEGK